METLKAQSHFSPLFSIPFYNGELNYPQPSSTTTIQITLEVPVVEPEALSPPQSEDSSEENIDFCLFEEEGQVVPVICEPPRESAYCVPESFVPEYMVKLDAKTPEREYFLRCVMVGEKGTGKHALIEASFSKDPKLTTYAKTGVDLVTKTAQKYQTQKEYRFWLRTLNGESSETKEVIWQSYYKSANAIVFVYDIGNKKSFEALKEAVEKVLEIVPREKFYGILVGNQVDSLKKREVSLREGMDFKSRYNFSHFIETSAEFEVKTPELLNRIDAKLKLTFEAMW